VRGLIKKPLIVLLGLLVFPALLSGVVYLLLLLDTDSQQLKQQIAYWFNQQTGNHLSIDGELKWQLFPKLKFSAGQVNLSDHRKTPVLNFAQLQIEADPLAFVKGDFVAEKVIADQVKLDVIRYPDGRVNLSGQPLHPDPSGKAADKQKREMRVFPFRNFELRNSRIRFDDQLSRKKAVISDLHVSLVPDAGAYYDINVQALVTIDDSLATQLQITSQLEVAEQMTFSHINSQLLFMKDSRQVDVKVQGNMQFSSGGDFIKAAPVIIKSADMSLQATLNAAQVTDSLDLDIKVSSFNPSSLLPFLSSHQQAEKTDILQHVTGELFIQLQPDTFSARIKSLLIDETQVQGDFYYSTARPEVKTNLSIGKVDVDRYLALLSAYQSDVDKAEDNKNISVDKIIEGIKNLKGQGEVNIQSVKYQGTVYEGVQVQFSE